MAGSMEFLPSQDEIPLDIWTKLRMKPFIIYNFTVRIEITQIKSSIFSSSSTTTVETSPALVSIALTPISPTTVNPSFLTSPTPDEAGIH